jgi:hypothetical protein
VRRASKPATPFRTLALLRAIVTHPRFRNLGAPAQSTLLVGIIQHGDHDGRLFAKQKTLGETVGRTGRRVGEALRACVTAGLLRATPHRRPDGTRGANDYALAEAIIQRADEIVLLWTNNRTKPSLSTSEDENVLLTSEDENVLAERFSNGSLNGFPSERQKSPSNMSEEEFEEWVATLQPSVFSDALIKTARQARKAAA